MTVGSVATNRTQAADAPQRAQNSPQQARIDRAMEFFTSKGWSRAQAAGIVGNLVAESGVKHDQAQHGGGPGYGLAQWEGPRQASFARWAGHDIHNSTMQEQLDFIQHELTTTESGAGRALRGADTASEAARIVMTKYERPADQSEGAQRGRAQTAENVFAGSSHSPAPQPPGPTPHPTPTPSPSPGNSHTVTVHSGDTLSGIAAHHGVSLQALLRANPQIHNPNVIHPGQTIHLPDGNGGSAPAPASHNYTVHSGDTMSAIASRNHVSLSALAHANPQIHNLNRISIGQTVHIPGRGGSSTPAPASHSYTVRSGDTMSAIATRNHVSLSALALANPQIHNLNRISVGQTVHIPGRGGSSTPAPAPASHSYTVRSGDTMSAIATRNHVSLSALAHANPQIHNLNRISVGQTVHIPGAGGSSPAGGVRGPAPSEPTSHGGGRVVDVARQFIGRNASELRHSSSLPMNPNVSSHICCANFVSAVLQKAGVLNVHTDLVSGSSRDGRGVTGSIGQILKARGWHVVDAAHARPGDVAIVNHGHHTELVASNDNGRVRLIGSNNINRDGSQQISYSNPYGNAWFLSPP